MDLQSTQVSNLYENLNKWMKQVWLHIPPNKTDSDSYSCYIIHDALKFNGEHNMLGIFKFYLNDIMFKYHTHIHTLQNIDIVTRFTNVITMNIRNIT